MLFVIKNLVKTRVMKSKTFCLARVSALAIIPEDGRNIKVEGHMRLWDTWGRYRQDHICVSRLRFFSPSQFMHPPFYKCSTETCQFLLF